MRVRSVVLGLVALAALAGVARADDEKEEEFSTTWFGGRLEVWYQPSLSLHAKVGGLQDPTGNFVTNNTQFDAHDDLGVKTNTPVPTYLGFDGGPIVFGAFADTRWVSLDAFWITPFQYTGHTLLTRSFSFAGATISASQPVDTTLAQSIAGVDIKVNILNNRYVRVSPILAFRALAVDWTVKDATPGSPFKASTEDIDFPLAWGRYKIFPYPEVGGEVRAGYRDLVEGDIKLTGMYINYVGVQAWTALFELGVTVYDPFVHMVGFRLGYRYYYFSARTANQSGDKQFDADLRLSGMTLTLIARF
ncbi:MAG TPA: hypothetical protein VFF73_16795 [Planctomycetota bacterium]|nr:hypothetical protein [Planctomycetota bacterium]